MTEPVSPPWAEIVRETEGRGPEPARPGHDLASLVAAFPELGAVTVRTPAIAGHRRARWTGAGPPLPAGDARGVHHPALSDDVLDGWSWAWANVETLGIPDDRLHLGGASAGANLATGVALRPAWPTPSPFPPTAPWRACRRPSS